MRSDVGSKINLIFLQWRTRLNCPSLLTMQAQGLSTIVPNMVAAGHTVPPPISPLLAQNTHDWVCAWVGSLNINSPEKSDAEIKAHLLDKGYTSRRALKYGILADPARLHSEWGISEALAGHLSEEAGLANASAVASAPVVPTTAGLTPTQLQLI